MRLKDAIEAAQRADAVAYVLLITDPMYPSNYWRHEQTVRTDWRTPHQVRHPDKLDKAFAEIAAELRSQYLLGFSSTNPVNDGKFRRLEVKSKDGYKIQARKGYYPPNDAAASLELKILLLWDVISLFCPNFIFLAVRHDLDWPELAVGHKLIWPV